MAVHRSVGEFTGVGDEWPTYVHRAIGVLLCSKQCRWEREEARYPPVRLWSIYPWAHTAPSKPFEVVYKYIADKVRAHYNPKLSQIVQRYHFNSRMQKPGESIACYAAELRQLSEHCGYGAQLEEMLRDRLVCGVANVHCQQRMLAEPDLDSDKAVRMAQATELAERDAQQLHP